MLHLDRTDTACLCGTIPLDINSCGSSRPGVIHLPPNCLTCGTVGIRREKKLGSIHLPSRGKRGQCFRSSACRHDCFAIRATCHLLVRHCRITGSPCHDKIGAWYKARLLFVVKHPQKDIGLNDHISKREKYRALAILILLMFSKYFYTSCITSYFTFFMMDKFGISVQASQLCLFVFLGAFAGGIVAGGMFGDKFGRKYVIWVSILGSAPFALIMPFANFTWTIVCTFLSGLIIASAFSSIVVYATDLMPDKVGLIAGIFFGLMFGLGGLGSAFFGWLADKTSIEFIFQVSAFLPLLGIIAGFLPNTQKG